MRIGQVRTSVRPIGQGSYADCATMDLQDMGSQEVAPVEVFAIAERLAQGGRVQRLAGGEKMLGANDVFRLWRENETVILKIYGTATRARRETHALEALGAKQGLPVRLEDGTQDEQHWVLFEDAGHWSLASLPENPGLARKAGEVLRTVHDSDPAGMSNLSRGMDQEWIAVDFVSTFRRLERYRGKLHISAQTLEAARATRPPLAGEPIPSHTNPTPSRFIVDDEGALTLINWEWATLAPPQWDLAKLAWLLRFQAGKASVDALLDGYGIEISTVQRARWAVYHAGMMLVSEAEETVRSGGADFEFLVAQLNDSIAVANEPVSDD